MRAVTTGTQSDERLDAIAAWVDREYGLACRARRLGGEWFGNYVLTDRAGRAWVLKTAPDGLTIRLELQAAILRHLGSSGVADLAPRLILTTGGTPIAAGGPTGGAVGFLMEFRAGTPLEELRTDPVALEDLGRRLRDLHDALRDFDHPGLDDPTEWDTRSIESLLPAAEHIQDPDVARLSVETVRGFLDGDALAVLGGDVQAVHNDLSGDNVLVSESRKVSTILDFGDAIRGPRLLDLVVTAAYFLGTSESRLLDGADLVIRGYHGGSEPDAPVRRALTQAIGARTALRLFVCSRHVHENPENTAYMARNLTRTTSQLLLLRTTGLI